MFDFTEIANIILNSRALLINGEIHSICEIEIYYNSEDHPDPYVHCHPDQATTGTFYFHRSSKKEGAKHKGGNYKGMDLSYSCEGIFCGVLIRSIQTSNNKLITGPCNVVDYILDRYEVKSIDELIDFKLMSFVENRRDLLLIVKAEEEEGIYEGKRIGLGLKMKNGEM